MRETDAGLTRFEKQAEDNLGIFTQKREELSFSPLWQGKRRKRPENHAGEVCNLTPKLEKNVLGVRLRGDIR